MSSNDDLPPPSGPAVSAADLRRRMAEIELEKAEQAAAKRAKLEAEQMAIIQEFMAGSIDGDDLARLRLLVQNALAERHTEVEVLRFPSSVLTDKGRAVSAGRADWPSTLTGKAATFYRLYDERARPLGYGIEARILDYPGGLLGDVGLFLTWGGGD